MSEPKLKPLKEKISDMISCELKEWDGITCYGDVLNMADEVGPKLAVRILRTVRRADTTKRGKE